MGLPAHAVPTQRHAHTHRVYLTCPNVLAHTMGAEGQVQLQYKNKTCEGRLKVFLNVRIRKQSVYVI